MQLRDCLMILSSTLQDRYDISSYMPGTVRRVLEKVLMGNKSTM